MMLIDFNTESANFLGQIGEELLETILQLGLLFDLTVKYCQVSKWLQFYQVLIRLQKS